MTVLDVIASSGILTWISTVEQVVAIATVVLCICFGLTSLGFVVSIPLEGDGRASHR